MNDDTNAADVRKRACQQARSAIQRRLDGEMPGDSADVAAHRRVCDSCRTDELAVLRLRQALAVNPMPAPSAGFADRVLAAYSVEPAQPRRLYRWYLPAIALAASVLIAAFWIREPSIDREVVQNPPPVVEAPDRPAPLGQSIAEASEAMASISRSAVIEAPELKLPSFRLPTAGPLEKLEPAVASLQNLGSGAMLSVSPMTHSAIRAADLFWRELGTDLDEQPGIN